MKDNKSTPLNHKNPKAKSAFKLTFRWLLKTIALVCVVLLGYAAFQFINVHPDRLYNNLFIDYTLSVSHKTHDQMTTLDSLYLKKNYQGVIGSFQSQESQSNQDYFLTAISYMQSEQYEQAILLFLQLQQASLPDNDAQDFQEDTDYYLALAFLKAGQMENALTLFEEIRQQPGHPFHAHISHLTLWKIKLLEMKQ